MKRILLTTFLGVTCFYAIYAQTAPATSHADSTLTATRALTFSGYLDAYYAYDFNRPIVNTFDHNVSPDGNLRPLFLYNHNRHNEFNLNNAFVKAAYAADRVRANVALQVGTYAQYNYAAEEALLRNVYEANAGVKLAKDLWLDAGIFSSHIGAESAVSKDCKTLTRSLAAENTPYYLSGAKLSYAPNGSPWSFTGLVVNGWQRIRENNGTKSFGTQIQFKPNERWLFNSSTFIGNEQPTATSPRNRYFHDFYITFQATPRLSLLGLADVGFQRNGADTEYDRWSNWLLIGSYQLSEQFFVAGRVESYRDPNGVIVASTWVGNGFQTTDLQGRQPGFMVMNYSLNFDYRPTDHLALRIEGRLFRANDAIFVREGITYTNTNAAITTSLAVSL